MRTLTIEQTVYNYSDLLLPENKILKNVIIADWVGLNPNWYNHVYDEFVEIALEKGFKVDKCYFSGFYSQGDGAMFEGSVIDFSKFISSVRINKLYENGSIDLEANFTHVGRYYYNEKSYEINFDVYNTDYYKHTNIEEYLHNVLQDKIKTSYESLCKELYQMLEKEYDYLTSEKYIMEEIKENNYEFDQDGNQIF